MHASKWDPKVKLNIVYHIQSESSQDDEKDSSVGPGRWYPRKNIKKYLPSREPSRARIAAQQIIGAQCQTNAAKALLSLFHTDRVTSNVESSSSSESTLSGSSRSNHASLSSKDDHSVTSAGHEPADNVENAPVTPTNSVTSTKLEPTEKEDSDDNLPLASLLEKEEDDLPLSVLRDRIKLKVKSYFKTTAYELIKYKRSRVFKCLKCDHTETLQKRINTHFRETHGLLTCHECGKECNTVSTLKKHAYDHMDKGKAFQCQDCIKSFPFTSQLKSH